MNFIIFIFIYLNEQIFYAVNDVVKAVAAAQGEGEFVEVQEAAA